MPASFATQRTSKPQKIGIGAVAVALVAVAFGAMAWSNLPLAPEPAFLPFYAGVLVLTDLLTAYLLLAQFRITRLPPMLALSAAYLYSGLIIIPHIRMAVAIARRSPAPLPMTDRRRQPSSPETKNGGTEPRPVLPLLRPRLWVIHKPNGHDASGDDDGGGSDGGRELRPRSAPWPGPAQY